MDGKDKSTHETGPLMEGILDGVKYTAEDFLNTTKPYEAVYLYHADPFQESRAVERMTKFARSLKVTSFKKMYQDYIKSLKMTGGESADNVAQFDQQDIELSTGEWHADDTGIWKYGSFGAMELACPHPIMPVERLKNIDTGELKVKLRYRRGDQGKRPWNEIIVDFDTLSNAKNIVSLSKVGVSVTSGKRSQNLVDYLTDAMDLNYDAIPEKRSVSRMGWNEEGFSPYVEGVLFDGNPGFTRTFEAIRAKGNLDSWLKTARAVRKYSVTARIVLAASFASVLIKPLGTLPFFVHLWGVDSGTGKSVAQMVGASVWGDPQLGGPYFPTFRSTPVGLEVIAGFLHNLPVFIDELQLAKDHRGKTIFNVYELAAGAGKQRSNRGLGLSHTLTWANCFVTSGESPIIGDNDGAGAVNRVIEIECKADERVIEDGRATAGAVREHYGHAGKVFIDRLADPETLSEVKQMYENFYEACLYKNATEKQALAAAIIVTADYFATQWIFQDSLALSVEEIEEFVKTREQVSAGARGYEYMCGWVSQNANRFSKDSPGDVYGVIEDGYAYIIQQVFDRACAEATISARSLKSYLKTRKLIAIRASGKGYTMSKRFNGIQTECVTLRLPGTMEGGFVEVDNEQMDVFGA